MKDANQNENLLYTKEFYQTIQDGSKSSAKEVVPLILELIKPKSVVDVGCGLGSWLSVFRDLGIEDYLGIDGDYIDREMLQISPKKFRPLDLQSNFFLDRKFDLAISLEVAEHLEPSYAESFVKNLTQLAPVVLFSAAIPFQGGTGHVNEQWHNYWVDLFKQQEYIVIDCLREKIWTRENIMPWYRQNLLIFAQNALLPSYPLLKQFTEKKDLVTLDLVHPEIYLKLQEKLAYFQKQQEKTENDLTNELSKSMAFWEEIQKLQTDIQRIYQEKEKTENDLTNELNKSTAFWEEIQKLQNDLTNELSKSASLWEQVQQLQAVLQKVSQEKEQTENDLAKELNKSASLWEQVQQLQRELEAAQGTISEMKRSKFWQLREFWITLKHLRGQK